MLDLKRRPPAFIRQWVYRWAGRNGGNANKKGKTKAQVTELYRGLGESSVIHRKRLRAARK